MGLEKIGHELVVKGAELFNRKMRSSQKTTEDFQKTLAKGAKSKVDLVPKGTESRLDKLRGMVSDFGGAISKLPGPLGQAGSRLAQLTEAVSLSTVKWIALTAAVTAASVVLLQLGARGARMEGVIRAFDAITASVGTTSQALLGELRQAAAGTIRDFELMQRTNEALTGSTGEFRAAFAESLPKLLEIARTQARATGRDFDYLFESLVVGVKRSSKLWIDNTGIVVDNAAANRKLAAELGISVEQLTDQQKQLALLNGVLEIGQEAIDLYGSKTKTAAEYAAGFSVRIQNMLDRLGIAILPFYTLLLQVGDALLETLIWPIDNLLIPALYELNKAIFGPLSQAFLQFKSLLTTALAPLATWLQSWLPPIIASFRLLGQVLAWLLMIAGKVFAGIVKQVNKFSTSFFAKLDPQKFFEGGARIIGALAEGFLWAANNILLPAVIAIATLVADFLVGFSPPKKGPLSAIDKGGQNVMLAWLDGLTGVGLEPVEAVAEQVNQALGDIGTFSAEQIESRLLVLDDALQPFIDNLEIAKAKFEAIVTPLEQILGIVDRRLDKALEGFFKGQVSEEVVRSLDRQREAVQDRIDAAQGMTDQAATQLALAQSQQAVERALLEIQRRRLTATDEEDAALAQLAEKLKKGSGDNLEEILSGGLGDLGGLGLTDPLAEFLGIDESAVASSMDGIKDAFKEGFGSEGLAALKTFKNKTGDLKDQLDRISGSSGAKKIKKFFQSIIDGANNLADKFNGFIGKFEPAWNTFAGLFDDVDPKLIESIAAALLLLVAPTIISGMISVAVSAMGMTAGLLLMTAGSVITGVTALGGALLGLAAAALPLLLLAGVIYAAKTNFGGFRTALDQVKEGLDEGDWRKTADGVLDAVTAIPKGLAQAALDFAGIDADVQKGLDTWPGIFDNLRKSITALPGFINDKLGGVPGDIWDALVAPFVDAVKGVTNLIFGGEGRDVDASLKSILEGIVVGVALWLFGLPAALLLVLYKVFEDEINHILDKIFGEENADSLRSQLSSLPDKIAEWLIRLGDQLKKHLLKPFEDVITSILGKLGEIGNKVIELLGLGGDGNSEGGHSPFGPGGAPWRNTQGGAKGATVRPNELWVVGEEGWEFFRPNVGGEVIPHNQSTAMLRQMRQITRAPSALMGLMSGPTANVQYAPSTSSANYNNTSNDNRQTTNNFNVRGQQSMRLAQMQAKAWS